MDVHELETEPDRRDAVPILRQLWTDRDPEEVLAWTAEPDYHCFGGFEGDDLVAVAGALVTDHLHHRRIAWLYDLVVDEPRRGEGRGGELVDFVEAWARERGCERVALASPIEKTATHDFYEAAGYERWGYVLERSL